MKFALGALMLSVFMSMSATSYAALKPLDDEEMRATDGRIFAINDANLERQLLTSLTLKDEAAALYIKEINSLAIAAKRGEMTESNFLEFYNAHLDRLFQLGIPESVLNYQMALVMRMQDQALRDQQRLEMQRALFQRFVGELTRFATEYRNNPNTPININLGVIFGSIPNVNLDMISSTKR